MAEDGDSGLSVGEAIEAAKFVLEMQEKQEAAYEKGVKEATKVRQEWEKEHPAAALIQKMVLIPDESRMQPNQLTANQVRQYARSLGESEGKTGKEAENYGLDQIATALSTKKDGASGELTAKNLQESMNVAGVKLSGSPQKLVDVLQDGQKKYEQGQQEVASKQRAQKEAPAHVKLLQKIAGKMGKKDSIAIAEVNDAAKKDVDHGDVKGDDAQRKHGLRQIAKTLATANGKPLTPDNVQNLLAEAGVKLEVKPEQFLKVLSQGQKPETGVEGRDSTTLLAQGQYVDLSSLSNLTPMPTNAKKGIEVADARDTNRGGGFKR